MIETILGREFDKVLTESIVISVVWLLTVIAVLIDLHSGISKAKVLGEKIQSGKLRKTIKKIGDYWMFLTFGLMLDIIGSLFPFYNMCYATIATGLAVILIEFKSMMENVKAKRSAAANIPELIHKMLQCTDPESLKEFLSQYLDLFNKK